VNETAAQHGRATPGQLLGRTMGECYPGIEQTEMYSLLTGCIQRNERGRMENEFVFPDGSRGWFEILIQPVPQGALILSVDITERRRMQEQLRRSQEDLAAILDCLADAVVVTDVEGTIVRLNPAAVRLCGWPEDEARGRPLAEVLRLKDPRTGKTVDPVDTILRHGIVLGLANGTTAVRDDGGEVAVGTSGAPMVDRMGVVRGVVLCLHDLTREHGLMSELQHTGKLEAIGRLAGGVAHDFNNALAVILAIARLAQESPESGPMVREDLQQIQHAAEHAAALTRQLLAFGRKQLLQPRVLDVGAVLSEVGKLVQRVLPEAVDVTFHVAPELMCVVADPGQLEQVVINLAVNASDAMPGGGRLLVLARNLKDASGAAWVEILVSDTGRGMDEEVRAHAFEPFFTTKENGRGTGLGLSTVYGIVKQSGGQVSIASTPGRGTSVSVRLPAVDARPDQPPAVATQPSIGSETVLLVEDDDAVRSVVGRVLRQRGYQVIECEGRQQAIAAWAEQQPVHLLMTDVLLADGSGFELAQTFRQQRPVLRVLFMSGYSDETQPPALEATVGYLEKPFTPEALAAKVRQVLDAG
jgi:two-component system, cell cycle sensor histidine kinase and response regulator CckA